MRTPSPVRSRCRRSSRCAPPLVATGLTAFRNERSPSARRSRTLPLDDMSVDRKTVPRWPILPSRRGVVLGIEARSNLLERGTGAFLAITGATDSHEKERDNRGSHDFSWHAFDWPYRFPAGHEAPLSIHGIARRMSGNRPVRNPRTAAHPLNNSFGPLSASFVRSPFRAPFGLATSWMHIPALAASLSNGRIEFSSLKIPAGRPHVRHQPRHPVADRFQEKHV